MPVVEDDYFDQFVEEEEVIYVNDGLQMSRDKDGYFYDHMEYGESNVELPMVSSKKDLAKMIYAAENLPHHYKEYLSLGEVICKSIPFKDYFYFIFWFVTKNVDDYSFRSIKSSIEELSCSTSQSKGEEKRTKSEDSLEPSTHGFFEKLFGFSWKRDQRICRIHEDDESPNPPSKWDKEGPCTTKDPIVQHLVVGNVEGEMNPNFFVADFKISAEDMGQIDDGETYFVSDPKDKHDSYL